MGSAQKPSRWVRRRKVCRVGPNVRFGPKADIRTPVLLQIKAPFREVPISADMFRKPILAFTAIVSAAVFSAGPGLTQEKSIVVASTTSTKDSGLFRRLLPIFTEKTGIAVKVLAVGTGQAFDVVRRGDADVVFTHAKSPG